MQETSAIYQALLADLLAARGNVKCETRLAVGTSGNLINKGGDRITFGGVGILVDSGGPEGAYDEDLLLSNSMVTRGSVFADGNLSVGQCIARQIDVELLLPAAEIPKQARLVPYVRLKDGQRCSEWLQKGVFYADSREKTPHDSYTTIAIHGYDAMVKAQADYPAQTALRWPATDIEVVREIARAMDISLDPRTVAGMDQGYAIEYPAQYSQQEVLGFIASMYAGCFVISDLGELLLIRLDALPAETRYLADSAGNAITFGGERILV